MMQTDTTGYGHIAKAACIGAGVIGAGWVARFLLAGIDVAVFDPHPDARRIVGEVVDNAQWAYERLTIAPLPPPGKLTFSGSIAEAVSGVDWIQESVPERLDLKRSILSEIEASCRPDALIGSSTSGLLPSALQSEMTNPVRFFVAHPYNPVYLLPLVEIVGGRMTARRTIDAAVALLAMTGMKGVPIDKEIDAFVGDRLLEALWREALWLIADDICTVETLDDVIRYSFGLRWAQMGLFQTYRIAGGEAGMRHFLAQFGPALQWPWTRLTDVVDLDEALVEKIAAQSDAQNEGLSIRRLERIRDENLIGILRALKDGDGGRGWGAGKLLAEFEHRLNRNASADLHEDGDRLGPPTIRVDPAWVDYNGHMTEHRYLQVFGEATDSVLRQIGVDADYVANGYSYYTVESHLRHLRQAVFGDTLRVRSTILSYDEKRLHLFHQLEKSEGGALVATGEHMLLHVDKISGRASVAPGEVLARLEGLTAAQGDTGLPEGVGGRSVQPTGRGNLTLRLAGIQPPRIAQLGRKDHSMMKYLAIGAALSLLTATTDASAAEPASCKTVRYADPGWTDIASTNALLKAVLTPLGYKADIATLSVPIVYRSLATSKLDIFLGNWMPAQTQIVDPMIKDGSLELIKVNLSGNRFTLAVPSYVAKAGVTSFNDLAAHADKFESKIYGIEAGASLNQNLTRMIEKNAYGLGKWKLVESSEQGMMAQVERAVKRQAWVVFPAWEPHPMNEQYDLTYLPGGDDYFGPNLGAAEVRTVARPGFSTECPNLTKLLKNMAFSVTLENAMMKRILLDGVAAEKAAAEALQKNPEVLEIWLKDVMTVDGKPGLSAVTAASK